MIHRVTHDQINAETGNKNPVNEKHNSQSDQSSDDKHYQSDKTRLIKFEYRSFEAK